MANRGLLALLATLVAMEALAAPAAVYKERPSLEAAHRALLPPLHEEIERGNSTFPELTERERQLSKLPLTRKEKLACLRQAEKWKEAYYLHPVQYLEYQRNLPRYQSREDQKKMETGLKFYRVRYAKAKKKRAFNVFDLMD